MGFMTRAQAWTHYFQTGDREPLVKAYWDSISYLAHAKYPRHKEDYFQIGMMGLLKAIDRIDPKRVKSKDAWVWLNVKGMMYNARNWRQDLSLDHEILPDLPLWEHLSALGEDLDMQIDVRDALGESKSIEEAQERLADRPMVKTSNESYVHQYHEGKLSLRALAAELGISRRQACKLVDKLPTSW
jgi:RNA polymerase sigma factor (sigma-70 family)